MTERISVSKIRKEVLRGFQCFTVRKMRRIIGCIRRNGPRHRRRLRKI